jgi:hypothetical protein
MAIEYNFTPELHLRDGRIIRHLDEAIGFARAQQMRRASIRAMKSCT